MNKIVIDQKKCIGCEMCVTDCVRSILTIKDGKAIILEDNCIGCGHCVAICPANAVRIENLNMDEVITLEEDGSKLNPDDLLLSIKSSRSIRQFKDVKIPRKKIDQIIEAGRFTATAQNKQNVSYVVVEDKKNIKKIEDIALSDYRKLKNIKNEEGNYILGDYRKMEFEDNFLFKKAPLLIMTKSDHILNAGLATKSMELMAESLGLGTFHVGLFTARVDDNEELKNILDVKEGEQIVTCLAIGYPNIEYKRTVPRKEARITWL